MLSFVVQPQRISQVHAEASAFWPTLRVDLEELAAFLNERFSGPVGESALEAACVPDLYLVCACLLGKAEAIEILSTEIVAPVVRTLRTPGNAAALEDLPNTVLLKLLAPHDGEPPKLVSYSGIGPLRLWVRMVAARMATDGYRKDSRRAGFVEDLASKTFEDVGDPEIQWIKEKYIADFQQALRDALAALDRDHRMLLRLAYLEGANAEQLCAILRMSRATLYRRLSEARDAVSRGTEKLLQERLKVEPREMSSLIRLLQSQLHASVLRVLEESQEIPPREKT
jgi:RNA polymerase sigma-70 factor (ECF subfamily)